MSVDVNPYGLFGLVFNLTRLKSYGAAGPCVSFQRILMFQASLIKRNAPVVLGKA